MILNYSFAIHLAIDPGGLLFVGSIIVGGFIIAIVSNFYSKRKTIMRELTKSPAKPINSVKDNETVRLHGRAQFKDEPLLAPLSGRKCVYYHVVVEQKGDKNSWRQIASEFKAQDFYLLVGDELALIKSQASHRVLHYLVADHVRKSGWRNDATPLLESFLAKHGKRSTTMLFNANKTLRYKEAVIIKDEPIVVKGLGKWQALDQPIEGFSYSRILTLNSTQSDKLIVTDDPAARKILHEK